MEENLGNRWRFVFAALVMQVCLGILYAWSVFKPPLAALNGWNSDQTGLPYAFSILFFAVGMIIAGIWQDKKGPRLVGSVGGLFLALGCLIAAFTFNNPGSNVGLVIAYGVLGGLGVGFAYVTPIATCVKWFPDKRGTIVGLAVLGFGAGSLIFGPVLEKIINLEALLAQVKAGTLTQDAFKAALDGNIKFTFLLLAAAFLVLVVGAAQFYKVPPAGYKPPGWNPPVAAGPATKEQFTPSEMVKTWQFYVLWLVFFIGSAVGLVVIGVAKPLITPSLIPKGPGFWLTGGLAVGIGAAFNGIGRLIWGATSDKIGRKATVTSMFATYVAAAILFIIFGGLSSGNYFFLLLGICFMLFAYGGYLALVPAIIADFWGPKNVGANYGIVFSAWGIGGFLINMYIGKLLKAAELAGTTAAQAAGITDALQIKGSIQYLAAVKAEYISIFYILVVLAAVGGALTLTLKRPMHPVTAETK